MYDDVKTIRLEAEFVIQDGEAGPKIYGMRMANLTIENKFMMEQIMLMSSNMRRDIAIDQEQGRLWEGAYLVTHRDDHE